MVAGHHRQNPATSSPIRKGIHYPSTYHPPHPPTIPPSPIPVWEKTPCHKQLSQSRQRLMELRPCDNAAFVAQRRGSQDLLTLVFSLYLMSPLTIQTLLLLLHHPLPLPVKGASIGMGKQWPGGHVWPVNLFNAAYRTRRNVMVSL